jgi:hypothetical protein
VVRHANAERRQRKTFFSELFGRGDLVFDIGANHGLPAFCKIDVEGYEEQVLAGLSQPLPALSLEFMTDTLPMLECCCQKLLPLAQYRFRFSQADTLAWQHDGWLGWDDMRRHLQQLGSANADLWGDVYAKRT